VRETLINVNVNELRVVEHTFVDDGVTVGVVVTVGVGVGVGVVGMSHWNTASKVNVSQLVVGVGVGVGQIPGLKSPSHKSGSFSLQLLFPNNIQLPPKVSERHQEVVPVL